MREGKASTFLKRIKMAYTLIAISYRMTSCGRFCFNSLSHRLSAYPEISKIYRRIDWTYRRHLSQECDLKLNFIF